MQSKFFIKKEKKNFNVTIRAQLATLIFQKVVFLTLYTNTFIIAFFAILSNTLFNNTAFFLNTQVISINTFLTFRLYLTFFTLLNTFFTFIQLLEITRRALLHTLITF